MPAHCWLVVEELCEGSDLLLRPLLISCCGEGESTDAAPGSVCDVDAVMEGRRRRFAVDEPSPLPARGGVARGVCTAGDEKGAELQRVVTRATD